MLYVLAYAVLAASPAIDVDAAIKSLGPQSDFASVERIARYGCRAVPIIVKELEAVGGGNFNFKDKVHYPRQMKALWSIATLRYITGQDFYAKAGSSTSRDSPQYQMLTKGAPAGTVKYFGIWMSRGVIYFASSKQQQDVVKQWKSYVTSGRCNENMKRDPVFWLYGIR